MNELYNRFRDLPCRYAIEFESYEPNFLSRGTPFEGHKFINIKK